MQGRYQRRYERRSRTQLPARSLFDDGLGRLASHKAGAAAWAIIFNLDEADCLFELAMFAA